MKYWLDCEFEENGKTIELISIGVVSEDGRQYYAEDITYNRKRAPIWLRNNVLPLLDGPIKLRSEIRNDLVAFCGEWPEIWGWYGSYDWVALCQLFGTMLDLPSNWPMFIREAMQYRKADSVLHARTSAEHHALSDAIWQRDVYYALKTDTAGGAGCDVNDIPDNELVGRALKSLRRRRGRGRQPLWANVADAFALGSTYSQQLCRKYGLDPDEMVKP